MNWFRRLFTPNRIYSDLSEEIEQHLTEKGRGAYSHANVVMMGSGKTEPKQMLVFGKI
jgi:hypothetical protein